MRDNQRMQKGSGIYTCEECGTKTRETGEGESLVKLCLRCWEIAGCINSVNDGNMTEAEFEEMFGTPFPESERL